MSGLSLGLPWPARLALRIGGVLASAQVAGALVLGALRAIGGVPITRSYQEETCGCGSDPLPSLLVGTLHAAAVLGAEAPRLAPGRWSRALVAAVMAALGASLLALAVPIDRRDGPGHPTMLAALAISALARVAVERRAHPWRVVSTVVRGWLPLVLLGALFLPGVRSLWIPPLFAVLESLPAGGSREERDFVAIAAVAAACLAGADLVWRAIRRRSSREPLPAIPGVRSVSVGPPCFPSSEGR